MNRRALLLGVAASMGLHVWVVGAVRIDPVDTSRPEGEPERIPPVEVAEVDELELLQIVEVEEEVDPPPLETMVRPIVADAAPAPNPEPDAASQESAGRKSAESAAAFASAEVQGAPAPTLAQILEAELKGRTGIAVSPPLPGQREIDVGSPVEVIDPHAGHDHAEDEGSEGLSFWQRVGRTLGIGGQRICRIIPKDAGKEQSR